MTRRTRRRLFVVLGAGLLGASAPGWVPRLLAALPAFGVTEVRVVGTRWVPPDAIKRQAAITPDASVWDDPEPWERRIREHPMVEDVTVRREGLGALEVVVVERRAVALVATPELRPVDGSGRQLPLEPAEAGLDLPLIGNLVEIVDGRVADPEVRRLAGVLDRLGRAHPEFVSMVSEASLDDRGGYRFSMLPGADAGLVLLPPEDPIRALDRVSLALGLIEDPSVPRADARFERQVVLTRSEGR